MSGNAALSLGLFVLTIFVVLLSVTRNSSGIVRFDLSWLAVLTMGLMALVLDGFLVLLSSRTAAFTSAAFFVALAMWALTGLLIGAGDFDLRTTLSIVTGALTFRRLFSVNQGISIEPPDKDR